MKPIFAKVNQAYHTTELNQEKKTRISAINLGFLKKDSTSSFYNGDISLYLRGCTPLQSKIGKKFLNFRKAEKTKITNEYIASVIGCSTKTVTRATNKFHADGFITKNQDNTYSPNNYHFHEKTKKGSHAHHYWFDTLSPENKRLFSSHGIFVDHKNKTIFSPRNVPQNKNLTYYNNINIIKPIPSARARATEARQKRVFFQDWFKVIHENTSSFHYGDTSREQRHVKGVDLMNQIQKDWILRNRSKPNIKDFLQTAKVKQALFTKPIEKLTNLLSLDDREQLKLIAFTDEALQYALDYVEPIVTGKKSLKVTVKDRMGWLISIACAFCKKNSIEPDWRWYFEFCDIMGIESLQKDECRRPLLVEKISKPLYKVFKEPLKESPEVCVRKLKSDIVGIEEHEKKNSCHSWLASYRDKMIAQKNQELSEYENITALS